MRPGLGRLALCLTGALLGAALRAQPPGIGRGGPPPMARADSGPDAWRSGLERDSDPVGAIIERRGLLALTDRQFAALRDLRRWHQRATRAVRDSLERMGGPPTARTGPPPGGAMGGGTTAPPAENPAVRPLRDSLRVWTRVARDSALALLTSPQRDTLAAVWLRYRDSLPARARARPRP